MKKRLTYIELKTGYSGNGPAGIGLVEFSKTGQTLYFDDKALKKLRIPGELSNYYNIETDDQYWVSGVKRDAQDRHKSGSGEIMIDEGSVDAYLEFIDQQELDLKKYRVVQFQPADKSRIMEIENRVLNDEDDEHIREYWDKNSKKFEL